MTSHNTSEWDAALLGILKALELALHANHVRGSRNLSLEVVGDSSLVVTAFKQRVSAHFPSQLRLMLSLAAKWKRVMGGDVTFRHVKRNFNKEADALATRAQKTQKQCGFFFAKSTDIFNVDWSSSTWPVYHNSNGEGIHDNMSIAVAAIEHAATNRQELPLCLPVPSSFPVTLVPAIVKPKRSKSPGFAPVSGFKVKSMASKSNQWLQR